VGEAKLTNDDRDVALDGLRGIAALMIVFYHCGVELRAAPFFVPGFTGVHLFFVLSGYLIARPFLARLIENRPLPSWRRYALRRLVRIYPTYLVALLVFVAMRVAGHLRTPNTTDIVHHVLLIFNFGNPAEFRSINIVMWTLAIEAQFYVILPLAAGVCRRLASGLRAAQLLSCGFVVVGLASRSLEYITTPGAEVRFRLPFSFLDLFACGLLAAYVELAHAAFFRERLWLRGALLLGAAALLLADNYWLERAPSGDWLNPSSLLQVMLYPIAVCAAFAAIVLCTRTRKRRRAHVLTWPALTFTGQISYSMYLYHVGVGYFLLASLPRNAGIWLGSRPPLYALVQLVPVFLVSYLAYRLVELPSLSYIERSALKASPAKDFAPSQMER